jgi:hypothetical protein
MDNKIKIACPICGGKGGSRKQAFDWKDSNWSDCLFCDHYGFIEIENSKSEDGSIFLEYNKYRKIITEKLSEVVGEVVSYKTEDMGKSVVINIIPYHTKQFAEFVKYSLKISLYSRNIIIGIHQVFHYNQVTDKLHYNWCIYIDTTNLADLDGFVDMLDIWEKRGLIV